MPSKWDDIISSAVALRHELHRLPELTWAETQTAAVIRAQLDNAGISWRPCADTGAIAILAPEAGGRHVALRADIDALPIRETTGLAWTSTIEGRMHACGHDGHTAAMVATANWLHSHERDLPGPVSLFFQPAEEGGHGARRMIEENALAGVDIIYGWHNWPPIPFGQAVCPDGPVMSANGTFKIDVAGSGGHASQPDNCRDPVLAAAAITVALQQLVSRRLPPQAAAVLSVTSIDAQSSDTVIPSQARLGGSIRFSDERLRPVIGDLITSIAKETARAYGVTAEVELRPRYGVTVNHPGAAENFRSALAAEFGPAWKAVQTPVPIMASEDFSYYLRHVAGAYALIGADDGKRHDAPCHSPNYDFNDALIPKVVRVLSRLAGMPVPAQTEL